jgi:3-deoxy-7-phosphoheptulonate synthase
MERTNNLNIIDLKPLMTPDAIKKELPLPEELAEVVVEGRRVIQRILIHEDPRPIVVAGPCSIHDPEASLEYARRLKRLQDDLGKRVLLVMRCYFEKPRTTIGWKGMLYDPYLDGSDDIEAGFRMARRLMLRVTEIGLPVATEILDPIVPQYLCDLISWAAIGARTTESQVHRQMASGLSMPVGFKNATDGNLAIAIEAIKAASNAHSFLGINHEGRTAIATTRGNRFTHLVLRGGKNGPNYQSEHVAFAEVLLRKASVRTGILIDCSHANCSKDPRRQRVAFNDVLDQLRAGNHSIIGMMLESFLEEDSQPLDSPKSLRPGVSITDPCIGWEETEELISALAAWR